MAAIIKKIEEQERDISAFKTTEKFLETQRCQMENSRASLIEQLYTEVIEPVAKKAGYIVSVETSEGYMPFKDYKDRGKLASFAGLLDGFAVSQNFVLQKDKSDFQNYVIVQFRLERPFLHVIPIARGQQENEYYTFPGEGEGKENKWRIDPGHPKESLAELIRKYEEMLPDVIASERLRQRQGKSI